MGIFHQIFGKKLFMIYLELFKYLKKYNENVTKEEYYLIYFQKTVDRINELINNNKTFKEIFEKDLFL